MEFEPEVIVAEAVDELLDVEPLDMDGYPVVPLYIVVVVLFNPVEVLVADMVEVGDETIVLFVEEVALFQPVV